MQLPSWEWRAGLLVAGVLACFGGWGNRVAMSAGAIAALAAGVMLLVPPILTRIRSARQSRPALSSLPEGPAVSAEPVPAEAIAREHLRVAEEQNRLLNAQYQPAFRLVLTTRSVGSERYDAVELWNDGAAFDSLWVLQRSYLEIALPATDPIKPDRCVIPCYYFFRREWTQAKIGLVGVFHAWNDLYHPTIAAWNSSKEFERLRDEVRSAQGSMRRRVFFSIGYLDRFRKGHTLNYEVFPDDASAGVLDFFGPRSPRLHNFDPNLIVPMFGEQDIRQLAVPKLREMCKRPAFKTEAISAFDKRREDS